MKSVVFLCLLGVAMCNADELSTHTFERTNTSPLPFNLWLTPGFTSYHFDRNAGFRDLNWGFGVQSNVSEELSLLAGNFINSVNARSNYAGAVWQPLSWYSVKIGVAAGGISGYPAMRNGGWFPAIWPWLSIRNDHYGANITYIPSYAGQLSSVISVQVIFRVW